MVRVVNMYRMAARKLSGWNLYPARPVVRGSSRGLNLLVNSVASHVYYTCKACGCQLW